MKERVVNMNLKAFLMTTFVKQNKWHSSSVLGHTIKVALHCVKRREFRFIPAALLHDIGKPIVAYQKDEDIATCEYSFTDHEEKSYEMIKDIPFISDYTKTLVRYHYLIRDMSKCKAKGDFKRFAEKKVIYDSLSRYMKSELANFLICDDLGKKEWKELFNV